MILASTSPQRKELIKYISYEVKSMKAEADETFSPALDVYDNLKYIAESKALAVVDEYNIQNDIVIGADTVVYVDGEVFLKPDSYEEAYAMIRKYRDTSVEIITGVCIATVKFGKAKTKMFTESSYVKFTDVTDENIRAWLAEDEYTTCSGGIKIEKIQQYFNARIRGSVTNIIGLPVEKLSRHLFHLCDDRFNTIYSDEIKSEYVRVRSACRVIPMEDDKVFLIRQKNRDGEEGHTLIGGGCTIEEDILEAGKRELLEEAGIIASEMIPLGSATIYWDDKSPKANKIKEAMYIHYICYTKVSEHTEHQRLDYEKEMISDIDRVTIDEAIEIFENQEKKWKNADNQFFYKYNLGTLEALKVLKMRLENE